MSASMRASLAKAIASERTRQDLTQQQLADKLGWSRRIISEIELRKRQVRVDELPEICEALNCGLMDLLSRSSRADARKLRLP
jgi:transcriptional regulator with XRE-family HTH domain